MDLAHIVCFSGGHSSAIVAVEVVKKYGKGNVILLNHNINPSKEAPDIKRFKMEVAAYLGIPITYANIEGITDETLLPDQFDIAERTGVFKGPNTGNALCTYYLKTEPFNNFLSLNFPEKNCIIYYGFDDDEQKRIQRRTDILGAMGFKTEFPLANWPDTLESTTEIGIAPPNKYSHFAHANCDGCLKGGIQHWYVTYCHRPDVFNKGKITERKLGYSILKDQRTTPSKALYLDELEPVFQRMKCEGVPQSEHYNEKKFQKYLKKYRLPSIELFTPCECAA